LHTEKFYHICICVKFRWRFWGKSALIKDKGNSGENVIAAENVLAAKNVSGEHGPMAFSVTRKD